MFSKLSKISAWYRIFIVFSIVWIIGTYIGLVLDPRKPNWVGFGMAFLMVIVFWGILWIVQGFRKNKQNQAELKFDLDPKQSETILKIAKHAEDAGMRFDEFLLARGIRKEEIESLMALYKIAQEEERALRCRILGIKFTNNPEELEKKIFCPICKTVFKKKDGEVDSDGISICSDCYARRN